MAHTLALACVNPRAAGSPEQELRLQATSGVVMDDSVPEPQVHQNRN